MSKIAIIDDEEIANDHFAEVLRASFPEVAIEQFTTRDNAASAMSREAYDVVILDIRLGTVPADQYAGFEILKQFSDHFAEQGTVVIVISGIPESNLRSMALLLEAWDFVQKPIEDIDLINKVRNAFASRRNSARSVEVAIQKMPADLTIDQGSRKAVHWKGAWVNLTITQRLILLRLVGAAGTPVRQEVLAKELVSGNSREAIAVHIANIRRAFEAVDTTFKQIVTIPLAGYKWHVEDK